MLWKTVVMKGVMKRVYLKLDAKPFNEWTFIFYS